MVALRRRIFSLPTLLSLGVAVAFIIFLATSFDVDWSQTWGNVRGMDPLLYSLALILYYVSFAFRGLRWKVLARNAGKQDGTDAHLPSAFAFSQLIVIGWFVNAVAWLRLGDAYRAYALSEESRGGFSWSLGTVLAERITDMVTVFVLIVVAALAFSATSDSSGSAYIVLAAFAMSLTLVILLAAMKGFGGRIARFLPGRFGDAYQQFQVGALGSFKQLPVVFLLSLTGWLLEAARLYFVVLALDLSITLPLVLVVALGHAILSTVPTPGGVGAVEPGVTGLLMLGLERHDAVSIALVDRSITYLSVIVLGGLVFLLWQLNRSRRRPSVSATPKTQES